MKSSAQAFDMRIGAPLMLAVAETLPLTRVGAGCGMLGAVLAVAGNVLLRKLPGDSEAVMKIVGENSHWAEIHFIIVLAAVLVSVFFVALGAGFETPWGIALSRVSVIAGLIGAGVLLVGLGIDSYAGKIVSGIQQQADSADRSVQFQIGSFVHWLRSSLVFVWLTLSFGIPSAFFGAAGMAENLWSKRLSRAALFLGGATLALSLWSYLMPGKGSDSITALLTIGLTVWIFTLARAMWRNASKQALRNGF